MAADIRQTATTGLDTAVTNYTITPKSLDSPANDDENYYSNPDFKKNNGAYLSIPEYKKAIDTYAIWVLGNGISSDDTEIQVILDHLSGCGKDNAKSIFNNLLRMKKVNGDAYAEVIRGDDKDKTLLNLKPLNPERMTNVTNKKGILIGYDYLQADGKKKRFKPEDIFHLINDRIGDETHGHSVRECVEWIIEARKEAMEDWRRISHRATIRVLYVNEDDKTKFAELKRDYAEAIKKGEVLILPGKPEDANFQDLTLPPA
jgi:hypothetical protein